MQLKRVIASLVVLVCVFTVPNISAYADTESLFINEDISLAYEISDDPSSNLRKR